jgi:hypothetical protein
MVLWRYQISRVIVQFTQRCDEFCGTPYTEWRSQGQPARANWPNEGGCCEHWPYVCLLNRSARSTYPVLITDNEIVTSSSIRVNELFVGCFQTAARFNSTVDTRPSSSIRPFRIVEV